MTSYRAAGVDIEAGERAVELMKSSVARTARPPRIHRSTPRKTLNAMNKKTILVRIIAAALALSLGLPVAARAEGEANHRCINLDCPARQWSRIVHFAFDTSGARAQADRANLVTFCESRGLPSPVAGERWDSPTLALADQASLSSS